MAGRPARGAVIAVAAVAVVAMLALVLVVVLWRWPGGESSRAAPADATSTISPAPGGTTMPTPGGTDPSAPGASTPASGSAMPAAEFASRVEAIPPAVQAEMSGVSWRPGCPVPLADLRLVHLRYLGFDGLPHDGELVVHRDVTDKIVRIFRKLFAAHFPIRKMVRVDAYGGSDDRSMADDNTSMFNCRNAFGSTKWSVHAYGKAIDVNTVENPYLPGKQVLPAAGAPYLDRRNVRPGMVVSGDLVVRAFLAEGFRWGGNWKTGTDYQHFEIGP